VILSVKGFTEVSGKAFRLFVQ